MEKIKKLQSKLKILQKDYRNVYSQYYYHSKKTNKSNEKIRELKKVLDRLREMKTKINNKIKTEKINEDKKNKNQEKSLESIGKLFGEKKKRTRKPQPKKDKNAKFLVSEYKLNNGIIGKYYSQDQNIKKVVYDVNNNKTVLDLFTEKDFIKTYKLYVKPYYYIYPESNIFNYFTYFIDTLELNNLFINDLYNKFRKNLKLRFAVKCVFQRYDEGNEADHYITTYFNSEKSLNVLNIGNFIKELQEINEIFIYQIEEFKKRGSGWKLVSIDGYFINVGDLVHTSAESYIPTPKKLEKNNALVNIQNKGNNCFELCIIANDLKIERNAFRETHYNKEELLNKYNWEKLYEAQEKTKSVNVKRIKYFEKNNKISVNVFYFNNQSGEVSLLEKTKLKIGEYEKTCDLLLIEDVENPEKKHYVLIRNFNRFYKQLVNNQHDHQLFPCRHCMNYFYCEDKLKSHIENGCEENEAQTLIMPTEEDNYIEFKNFKNIITHPFVIYADTESLLEKIFDENTETDDRSNQKTKKYQEHKINSYCQKVVSNIKLNNSFKLIRRDTTEEAQRDMVATLEETEEEIMKYVENPKPMKKLTPKQYKNFEESKKCYMCNKEFEEELNKYKCYDEETGKYKGASHINCIKRFNIKKKKLSKEEFVIFKEAKECCICKKEFLSEIRKVRDHDHFTGEYRGVAHSKCNLECNNKNFFIPVIFHNLKGYDAHFIINAFDKYSKNREKLNIKCIPNSGEKYISFTIGKLRFIDSMAFLLSSLDKLVKSNLDEDENAKDIEKEIMKVINNIKNKFNNITDEFKDLTDEQLYLITRKGVYPYDYADDYKKFNLPVPTKKHFYNKLNDENISEKEYEHVKKVCEELNIKNFGEYHDLYLKTDVLLLADVFENFRKVSQEKYQLDPVYYYTLPGYSWDAMLKFTGKRIELFTDIDMYIFAERGIRGGISTMFKRHAKANNPYMKNYNEKEETVYLSYLDANNLYGYAMMKKLPIGGYYWDEKLLSKSAEKMENYLKCFDNDGDVGHILEVSLKYPQHLHDLHNDYPLAPEQLKVTEEMLSEYSMKQWKLIKGKDNIKLNSVKKLIPNFYDKKNYVVTAQSLKLYLSLGLKIEKVHKILSYRQEDILGSYITKNTEYRSKTKSSFEKDFFKLMNNSVFGKTMENVRNRVNFRIVTNKKSFDKAYNQSNFKRFSKFSEKMYGIFMKKQSVKLYKPILMGMCILDFSKCLMYDTHYNVFKKKWGNNINLLMTDTDSFIYEIKTEDIYSDMYDMQEFFDLSEYPKDFEIKNGKNKGKKLYDEKNKKVVGKFKDELCGKIMSEFVGLKSKMYSYKKDDDTFSKVGKGVKKSVLKKDITFQNYKETIFDEKKFCNTHKMNNIVSRNHQVFSIEVNKITLTSMDDKRYYLDSINSLGHGHFRISK